MRGIFHKDPLLMGLRAASRRLHSHSQSPAGVPLRAWRLSPPAAPTVDGFWGIPMVPWHHTAASPPVFAWPENPFAEHTESRSLTFQHGSPFTHPQNSLSSSRRSSPSQQRSSIPSTLCCFHSKHQKYRHPQQLAAGQLSPGDHILKIHTMAFKPKPSSDRFRGGCASLPAEPRYVQRTDAAPLPTLDPH